MIVTLCTERIRTLDDIRAFLGGNEAADITPHDRDEAFGQLSGPATKRIPWRLYHVFGDERFKRLAGIPNGHIYNLRGRRAYRSARTTFRATRGAILSIGTAPGATPRTRSPTAPAGRVTVDLGRHAGGFGRGRQQAFHLFGHPGNSESLSRPIAATGPQRLSGAVGVPARGC